MKTPSSALARKILSARLLTRLGDQAWDFAVPLAMLKVLPGQLKIAAIYYLLVRLGHVLLMPKLGSKIDRMNRPRAIKLGIGLQFAGVLMGAICIGALSAESPYVVFIPLIIGGLLAGLGSTFTEISIANDLVPSAFAADELAKFNSRLRQVDLFTEVTAPILAGLLLLLGSDIALLLGFYVVALWNLLSFVPEYSLLQSIFKKNPNLAEKPIGTLPPRKSLLGNMAAGWRAFFNEPVAPAMLCYALLWLSALSPHGVLLTAFLKDGWRLPEWGIGLFRGLGALFGLAATLLFPIFAKKFGLIGAGRAFVLFQAACVLVGLLCFEIDGLSGQIGFLILILFSRIGLYGFSLGEMQIRQTGIQPGLRGEVNGFASALTAIATLILFLAGSLLPSTDDFRILVWGSVGFVVLSAGIFTFWSRHKSGPVRSEKKL